MALRSWNRSLAALVLVVLAARAEAGLLPTSSSAQADGSNTRYTYGVVLTSDSTLKTGDFFTVYDFPGAVTGTNVQPAGWTFSSANTGMTPPGINVTDNAAVPNATWTYSGPTLTGQMGMGNFMLDSTNTPSTTPTSFAALTQRAIDGQNESTATTTLTPSSQVTIQSIPEPATLALVGIGLPFAGLFGRWRRKK